jgi:hypothetical protein
LTAPRLAQSPLARMVSDRQPMGDRALAAELWHRVGVLVVLPQDLDDLSAPHRSFVEHIAGKLYGARVTV